MPRVLAAARTRFLNDGVEGASLRAIATEAGTSIGMIYYYFPTKDDLFLAVVEDVYGKVLGEIESTLATSAPTEEKLRVLYDRIARMDDREFEVFRIVIREALVSSARLEKLIGRFASGHLPHLVREILGAQGSGAMRGDVPPAAVAMTLLATAVMPQLIRRRIGLASPALDAVVPAPRDLAEAISKVVLEGLRVSRRSEA